MRSRVVCLLALLVLLGAVSPALGDVPADAVGAVDALVLGDDPLDPYDDPPAANAFAGAAGLDPDEDADIGEDEVEDGRVQSKQATLTYVQRIYDTAQQPSRGVRYDGSGPRLSSPGKSGGSLYLPLQQARPQQRRPSATNGAVQPAPPLDGGLKPNSRSLSALSCAAGKYLQGPAEGKP